MIGVAVCSIVLESFIYNLFYSSYQGQIKLNDFHPIQFFCFCIPYGFDSSHGPILSGSDGWIASALKNSSLTKSQAANHSGLFYFSILSFDSFFKVWLYYKLKIFKNTSINPISIGAAVAFLIKPVIRQIDFKFLRTKWLRSLSRETPANSTRNQPTRHFNQLPTTSHCLWLTPFTSSSSCPFTSPASPFPAL